MCFVLLQVSGAERGGDKGKVVLENMIAKLTAAKLKCSEISACNKLLSEVTTRIAKKVKRWESFSVNIADASSLPEHWFKLHKLLGVWVQAEGLHKSYICMLNRKKKKRAGINVEFFNGCYAVNTS